jgi:hypothetical protein
VICDVRDHGEQFHKRTVAQINVTRDPSVQPNIRHVFIGIDTLRMVRSFESFLLRDTSRVSSELPRAASSGPLVSRSSLSESSSSTIENSICYINQFRHG